MINSRNKNILKRLTFLFLLSLLSLLCLARPGQAEERQRDIPEGQEQSQEGYREIAAFELKQMIDSGTKLLIINVLSEIEFAFQHITGSINIPITKMPTTTALPADKSLPLVFHCLSDR